MSFYFDLSSHTRESHSCAFDMYTPPL